MGVFSKSVDIEFCGYEFCGYAERRAVTGNKRAGATAAITFLLMNGWQLLVRRRRTG
jgi:uncharacterized protein (TIGR03382 family)